MPFCVSHHALSTVTCRPQEPNQWNPYELKDTKTSGEIEDQVVSVKGLRSPSEDEDIKKVTKLFCDWVVSLVSVQSNSGYFLCPL